MEDHIDHQGEQDAESEASEDCEKAAAEAAGLEQEWRSLRLFLLLVVEDRIEPGIAGGDAGFHVRLDGSVA